MPLGAVLYDSGCKISHVYFPESCIVSMLFVLESGASAEIAVVGFEGMVGISLFMGGETTPSRAVIQSAGKAYRVRASFIKQEFNQSPPVMHLLLRFTQALITQMTQTAVCNRHHTLDQQLSRWLLLSLDRLTGFVFQYHHLISAFSAIENVMLPMVGDATLFDDAMRARRLCWKVWA